MQCTQFCGYGYETWNLYAEDARRQEVSHHRYLRSITRMEWSGRTSNVKIWHLVLVPSSENIQSHHTKLSRLRPLDHVLRTASTRFHDVLMQWNNPVENNRWHGRKLWQNRYLTPPWLGSKRFVEQWPREDEAYASSPWTVTIRLHFSVQSEWLKKCAYTTRLYFVCWLLRYCFTFPPL